MTSDGSLSSCKADLQPHQGCACTGSQVTAVSNSKTQATHIRTQAQQRGLSNLTAVTADVVTYQAQPKAFDRVVSVEMFEHMKNYKVGLGDISPCAMDSAHQLATHRQHHASSDPRPGVLPLGSCHLGQGWLRIERLGGQKYTISLDTPSHSAGKV